MPGLLPCLTGLCFLVGSSVALAQAGGTVSGIVTDSTGARLQHASVHAVQGSQAYAEATDKLGHYAVMLRPGQYDVEVEAAGFQTLQRQGVDVRAGSNIELNFRLSIASLNEAVNVPPAAGLSTGAADNKSALIFDEEQLAGLSDDDREMERQVLALAGTDGIHSPQVFVDGFTGGRFPPKNTIRQIRVNENPYTAQYDQLGFGRVEIFTKPGTGAFHGTVSALGDDKAFDAPNPFATNQPPYHSLALDGNLSGPLGRKTSIFLAGSYFDLASNAVVNTTLISEAVHNPSIFATYSFRTDRQLGNDNTLTARYEYNRIRQSNAGVGLLVLPSEGFNSATTTQTLQLSDTQILSSKVVNETRFQYIRTRLGQSSLDHSPTLIVQGAFNGGGGSAGDLRDAQDRYEFQDYLSFDKGKHFIRTGIRYRLLRDANDSTANYNGQYIFPDLATYEAAQAGTGQGATQYSITTGDTSAVVLTGDLGVYAEDEWKLAKSFTLNYGLRFETQSGIPDHADWAPRVGFAWAIGQKGSKSPFLVLRGGAGLFYDRFAAGNLVTSIRQNGLSQQTYLVQNPDFFEPAPPPTTLGSATAPTTYGLSPNLRAEYAFVAGVSADHSFGKYGSVSLGYFQQQGFHQYLSRNINAPVPGTFVVGVSTSGIRPLGGNEDVYQFQSEGTSRSEIFTIDGNFNLTRRVQLFGYYEIPHVYGDTSGATAFPTDSYSLHADYGRQTGNRQQGFIGVYSHLPWGLSASLSINGNSSSPFNITIGEDLNGDGQYNDRPAFATDLTRPSVVKTSYGIFDKAPIAGQSVIPYNYGNTPGFYSVLARVSKDFKVGPRPSASTATASQKTSTGAAARPDRPYSFSLGVEAVNLLNHVSPSAPVGVLDSPLFGHSLSLSNSSNAAANRTIAFHGAFNF